MVEQEDFVGGAGGGGEPELVQGAGGGVGGGVGRMPAFEGVVENFAVGGVVVDDQHPATGERAVEEFGRWRRRGGGEGDGDPENGSFAGGADDTDGAAHQLGQAAGDGQPQAGATEAAGGGAVGLDEALEEIGLVRGGDADAGVLNLDAQVVGVGPVGDGQDAQDDLALFGELDGVAQQVEDDLAQAHGVAVGAAGGGGIEVEDEFEAFLAGGAGLKIEGALELVVEVEVDGFQHEAPGLDLGEVEDVVDDGQERLAAEEQSIDKVFLVGAQRSAHEQVPHADDAVEGRADLVAHVGQKGAFGAVGGLGGLLGPVERGVGCRQFSGTRLHPFFQLAVELAEAFLAGGEGGGAGGDELLEAGFFAAFEVAREPGGGKDQAERGGDVESPGQRGAEPRGTDGEREAGLRADGGPGQGAHAEEVVAFLEAIEGGGADGASGGPVLALLAGTVERHLEGDRDAEGICWRYKADT